MKFVVLALLVTCALHAVQGSEATSDSCTALLGFHLHMSAPLLCQVVSAFVSNPILGHLTLYLFLVPD